MTEKLDITERATTAGWHLPEGFTVRAWTEQDWDIHDPRDTGDVYASDVEEQDYSNPTHGFCRDCEGWIYRLDQAGADAINHATPADADPEDPAYMNADPGMWANKFTGVSCPDSSSGHTLDDPVAVRWWREDEWWFVGVLVEVVDSGGRAWGESSLWAVEAGSFPVEINVDTGEITEKLLDPLTDPYHPLPCLINEAMGEAADALGAHTEAAPVITRDQKHGGERR